MTVTEKDQYLFGPDILVAPILNAGQNQREVYLPEGVVWVDAFTGREHRGGQVTQMAAELESIPVFVRQRAGVLGLFMDADHVVPEARSC